ncbi:MAG: response regulator [Polyangiaceae bacterium]|nr:response regulator [Polyangiaceae bacterium]
MPSARPRGRLHVLVVDDCAVTLELTREWLEAAGHRVSTRAAAVGTAAEILAIHPDVLLIDVIMPGIRGDDLARILKHHPSTRHVPIILHSSIDPDELLPMIMTAGVIGVIEKTSNQGIFAAKFQSLTARLHPLAASSNDTAARPQPKTSGTYTIDGLRRPSVPDVALDLGPFRKRG